MIGDTMDRKTLIPIWIGRRYEIQNWPTPDCPKRKPTRKVGRPVTVPETEPRSNIVYQEAITFIRNLRVLTHVRLGIVRAFLCPFGGILEY
jgi:hypothetical protein